MHRQPWPYMDHMASSALLPFAAIATVKTRFVCIHIFLKTLTNINRITKPVLQQNSVAKINYIYLISPQNIKSKYFFINLFIR